MTLHPFIINKAAKMSYRRDLSS